MIDISLILGWPLHYFRKRRGVVYYQKSKSNSFTVKTKKQLIQRNKCRYIYVTKQKKKKQKRQQKSGSEKKLPSPYPRKIIIMANPLLQRAKEWPPFCNNVACLQDVRTNTNTFCHAVCILPYNLFNFALFSETCARLRKCSMTLLFVLL